MCTHQGKGNAAKSLTDGEAREELEKVWKALLDARKKSELLYKKITPATSSRQIEATDKFADAMAQADGQFAQLDFYLKHRKTLAGDAASHSTSQALQRSAAEALCLLVDTGVIAKSLKTK